MTVYDSPDYLEAWWMRRDSSKCWVEFAALEKFRHPQVSSYAIASVKFLSLFATRLDTDNALCPHVVTRKIRPTKPEREKKYLVTRLPQVARVLPRWWYRMVLDDWDGRIDGW